MLPKIADTAKNDRSAILRARYVIFIYIFFFCCGFKISIFYNGSFIPERITIAIKKMTYNFYKSGAVSMRFKY